MWEANHIKAPPLSPQCLADDPQGVTSHREIHKKLSFAVRSRYVFMDEGGYEEQNVVPGGR